MEMKVKMRKAEHYGRTTAQLGGSSLPRNHSRPRAPSVSRTSNVRTDSSPSLESLLKVILPCRSLHS